MLTAYDIESAVCDQRPDVVNNAIIFGLHVVNDFHHDDLLLVDDGHKALQDPEVKGRGQHFAVASPSVTRTIVEEELSDNESRLSLSDLVNRPKPNHGIAKSYSPDLPMLVLLVRRTLE